MQLSYRTWIRRSVLLSLAVAPVVGAQQFVFQHTNSISLSSQFFGPDIPNSLPSSGYGSNPIAVTFDGTSAYVSGFNNTGTTDMVGIVRVDSVLGTTPTFSPLSNTKITTTTFLGLNGLTQQSGGIFASYDAGSGSGSRIYRYDSSGNSVWNVDASAFGGGYRPSAIAIDPLADAGTPALGMIGIGSGRRVAVRLSDGALLYSPSGGPGTNGEIINALPTVGNTYRGIAFDDAGNIATAGQGGAGFGLRDTVGGTNFNRFTTISGTGSAVTGVLLKTAQTGNLNPGQDVEFIQGLGPNTLIAYNPRGADDANTAANQTITDSTNVVQNVDARHVLLRNTNGTTTGLSQLSLAGGEDGIGGAFSGQTKGYSVGKDANNNPVLFVVNFAEKTLDVYSVEPTYTAAGAGVWSDTTKWLGGLSPNSALQNARFGSSITAPTTITLSDARSTKNLKFDNANSYTISGAGTLTLDGPDAWGSQIQVLNGSHTVAVPVTLAKSANFTVNNATDTLNITGDISAAGKGVTKRGAGTAVVKNLRLSALALRGGTLTIASNGTASGASSTGSLVIEGATDAWTSTLDLKNNAIVADGTLTPIADLFNQIKSGYANGAWTGTGIRSSTAASSAAPTKGALAYATKLTGVAAPAVFSQVTVDDGSTMVMYTLAGDATMDRKVNTEDFNLLAGNFGTGTTWVQGDSNYDGLVDSADFGLLVGNFGASIPASAPTLGSVVPEPASFGVIGFGLSAMLMRRRK